MCILSDHTGKSCAGLQTELLTSLCSLLHTFKIIAQKDLSLILPLFTRYLYVYICKSHSDQVSDLSGHMSISSNYLAFLFL